MTVVIREVRYPLPIELLQRRKACGHDRRDEVWEGELHVVPPAHEEHGRLELHLSFFFKLHWEDPGLGRVSHEPGVKRPGAGPMVVLGVVVPEDYRIPDLTLLLPERFDRLIEG